MQNVASSWTGSAELAPGIGTQPIGGRTKRWVDLIAATVALVFFSPIFLCVWLLVRAIDGGPAIFRHRRVGFGGREFVCLKFRTMEVDAERTFELRLAADPEAAREWRETHKLQNDPRVTRLGKLLRRSSLDELPQLLNILKGEMSLIGPRPIVVEEIPKYHDQFRVYVTGRPGLTGLWQVQGRNETTYAQRVAFDVDYLRNWSFLRDLTIVAMTGKRVLDGRGAS
jgi:exopolysaccharide production protein ExoY